MKVISIKEPYASLIMMKKKKIETRSFKTKYRGEIYIHASKTKSNKEYLIDNPKPGYILCKCNLVDCIYMDEDFINKIKKEEEYNYGLYEVGRYAWILDDIEKIEPIYAKGQLGIWNFKGENNE